MEQIVGNLAWPGVTLAFALVVIFVFRAQISALIDRTTKVGKGGIETFESQTAPPVEGKKAAEEFFRSFDSPLLLEAEESVRKDIQKLNIGAADREKALVRALARMNILWQFERAYATIWLSQVACLRHLNSRSQGAPESEVLFFYNQGKAAYPTVYQAYTFEQWIGYLRANNLTVQKNANIFITVAGREFLKYMIESGKAGPFHG